MKDHNSVSDEEMMDDRRQESHIASVVAKIKTEKKEASSYSRDIKDKGHRESSNYKHAERQEKEIEQRREREKDDRRKREQSKREKDHLALLSFTISYQINKVYLSNSLI